MEIVFTKQAAKDFEKIKSYPIFKELEFHKLVRSHGNEK
jgi:hypothetical protein